MTAYRRNSPFHPGCGLIHSKSRRGPLCIRSGIHSLLLAFHGLQPSSHCQLQVRQSVHVEDIGVVRRLVGGEVLVYVTIREELGAHVVEVVRSGEPSPGAQKVRVPSLLYIRFQGLHGTQGVVLQIIASPGREIAFRVCPGDEVGDIETCHG